MLHYAPLLEKAFRKEKRIPCGCWRVDWSGIPETYVKVRGGWKYYYRAVDRNGEAIDFLLKAKRDKKAALRYFKKAIGSNGKPSLINVDKSGANTAAIKQYVAEESRCIEIRQCKYLNNVVGQVVRHSNHRLIKRITKPMLGFKNFFCAQRTLAGIEVIRMLKKGQIRNQVGISKTPAELFYTFGKITKLGK